MSPSKIVYSHFKFTSCWIAQFFFFFFFFVVLLNYDMAFVNTYFWNLICFNRFQHVQFSEGTCIDYRRIGAWTCDTSTESLQLHECGEVLDDLFLVIASKTKPAWLWAPIIPQGKLCFLVYIFIFLNLIFNKSNCLFIIALANQI